jgi:citrate synthase
MKTEVNNITDIILEASRIARQETSDTPEPEQIRPAEWPIDCTIGPGLEGAIACESKVGYVNGTKGWLIYRGYDIFDLCAFSNFEEVSYLLLHGKMPNASELQEFKENLLNYSYLNKTLRLLMGFPLEEMHAMGALRLGTNLMRQEFTNLDRMEGRRGTADAIGADEDSIAMETIPLGSDRATYEFIIKDLKEISEARKKGEKQDIERAAGLEACYQLIAGVSTIVAAISRIHNGRMPIEPDPSLSHSANLLYMITGRKPTPLEERIMDITLILHADHGMNATTFATMVVASTLSDMYLSVGSGIAALSGPLHGGANEEVVKNLKEIGTVENVEPWVEKKLAEKGKISGFGHRVYKAYDPRARVLKPLAEFLVKEKPEVEPLYNVARELEDVVLYKFGREKKIFPNVDFYSGLIYSCLGIDSELFTPLFAVSRVSGWTARVLEYMENNRIFRPRARYTGEFNKKYVQIEQR